MFRPSLGLFESSWRFWEPKCWNVQFLPLTWPWPDTWPFKKNFKSALEPSRRDLSNAASPVSLRSLVWELAWGGFIRPPPPGQWRSAETPVKRGIIGQPWVTSEWRHVSSILINKMGLRDRRHWCSFKATINWLIWNDVELVGLQNCYLGFSIFFWKLSKKVQFFFFSKQFPPNQNFQKTVTYVRG